MFCHVSEESKECRRRDRDLNGRGSVVDLMWVLVLKGPFAVNAQHHRD